MKIKKEKYDFDSDPAFQRLLKNIIKLIREAQRSKEILKKQRKRNKRQI